MLDGKSQENKTAADLCKKASLFNAGASRAYYAIYQIAKHILDTKKYDYKAFIEQNHLNGTKPYSHGTMPSALVDCIKNNFPKSKEQEKCIHAINVYMNSLYAYRVKADYKNENLTQTELNIAINQMNKIKQAVESLSTCNSRNFGEEKND